MRFLKCICNDNENKTFSWYLGHCHSHFILKIRKKNCSYFGQNLHEGSGHIHEYPKELWNMHLLAVSHMVNDSFQTQPLLPFPLWVTVMIS